MKIHISNVGFCWGIDLAYKRIAEDTKKLPDQQLYATHRQALPGTNGDLDTLTRIANKNPKLVAAYPGVEAVRVVFNHDEIPAGETAVLGFHGISRQEVRDLKARGVAIRDHKCPFIESLDKKMEQAVAEGFNLIFMGKLSSHHARYAVEVAQQGGRQCHVLNSLDELQALQLPPHERWALFAQVTGNSQTWEELVRYNEAHQLAEKVVPTLCSDSYDRQQEAMNLAEQCDAVMLVDDGGGGASSAFEVLTGNARKVLRLRWREDHGWVEGIDFDELDGIETLGLIGGINTPPWALQEVSDYILQRSQVTA